MGNIGVITEQGDLGLGFDLLNNKDQQAVAEATKNQQNSNEEKKDKYLLRNVSENYISKLYVQRKNDWPVPSRD